MANQILKRKSSHNKSQRARETRTRYASRMRPALAHLRDNERTALADYVSLLRQKFPDQIEQVILFGSKARGDADSESDLDLLIVVQDPRVQGQLHEGKLEIEIAHKVVFGGTSMNAEEFEWNREHRSPIYRSVISEGIDLLSDPPRRLSPGAKPAVYQPPKKKFKVDENAKISIKIRFEEGLEDLNSGRKLIESGFYRGAISRAYYAVFAISTAVLLTMDLVRARHSGVQSAFHQYFVNEKRLEPEYGELFDKSLTYRIGADYKSWRFTKEKTEQVIANCEKFFARMERYLREVGALD